MQFSSKGQKTNRVSFEDEMFKRLQEFEATVALP